MISAKVRLALRVLLLALLIKNSASGGRFSSGGDAHFPDDDIHGFSDTDTDYQDPSTRSEGEKRAAVSPSSTSTTTTTTSEQSEELPKGPEINPTRVQIPKITPPSASSKVPFESSGEDDNYEKSVDGLSSVSKGSSNDREDSSLPLLQQPHSETPALPPTRPPVNLGQVPNYEEKVATPSGFPTTEMPINFNSKANIWLKNHLDISLTAVLLIVIAILGVIVIFCCAIYCRQRCRKVHFGSRSKFYYPVSPKPDTNSTVQTHPFSRSGSVSSKKSLNLLGSTTQLSAIMGEQLPSRDLEGLDLTMPARGTLNPGATLPLSASTTTDGFKAATVTSSNEDPRNIGAASEAAVESYLLKAQQDRFMKAQALETERLRLEAETRAALAAKTLKRDLKTRPRSGLGK